MKILHYLPDIDKSSGGVMSYIQTLTESLGQSVDLHVLTCHTKDEMKVTNCNLHYLSVRYIPKWDTKREFLQILDEIHPDVFHTNSCWIPTSALTAIWAKDAGYKVVYTPHGMLEPWIIKRSYLTKKLPALLLYQKRALKKADMLLATSKSERDNLLALGYNKNICVIPNAIDVDSIALKADWRRKKRILYLGRIHEKKGINHLLEAINELKTQLQGYVVDIVGDSDIEQPKLKTQLITYANKLEVTDIVQFYDGIYNSEKWKYFQGSDILILPTYSENFGIVVAEALACGVPVITTKGTPWEELETKHCGWWIEIGTKPLVEAILSFLNLSEMELEKMGKNGRRLIEEKYSIEKVGEEFLKMYASI